MCVSWKLFIIHFETLLFSIKNILDLDLKMNSNKSFDIRKNRPVSMNIDNIIIPELKLDDTNLFNKSLTNLNKKGRNKGFKKSLSNVSVLLILLFKPLYQN